ncbi:MAG TPA: hypothetical protein VEV38_05305 [Candidatus Eremiobacteraceae bacterium]|nr:hypothetical protein [Candidatus Eremiobacteraceae bacterium]
MMADDRTPADLLLLRERKRRMTSTSVIKGPVVAAGTSSEPVLLESDTIVDGLLPEPAPFHDAALHLYRPLSTVTLAQMSWTGAIDHGTLMLSIGCAPLAGQDFLVTPGWFANLALSGAAPAAGEPALHVSLTTGDVELIESAATRNARSVGGDLVLATLLPSTIVGADASTIDAATAVLTTYRRASLVVAWLEAIGGGAADATSRRDEAAAAVMSMLRALLGEA